PPCRSREFRPPENVIGNRSVACPSDPFDFAITPTEANSSSKAHFKSRSELRPVDADMVLLKLKIFIPLREWRNWQTR
ncbi:MAG: hypothetical protein NXI22_24135, partial [bacterium]|nr:hypothetical protein [bacterium]